MSRETIQGALLLLLAAFLAVVLFVAGAIWRGRVTP
jgi:hypothetical protein